LDLKIKIKNVFKVQNLIEAENLSYSKNQKIILNNLSFCLQKGQHLAIMGVNGAGKSILGQILAVDILPKSGSSLKILGFQIGKTNLWQLRQKIGLVSNRQMQNFNYNTAIQEIIASGFSGFYENQTKLENHHLEKIENILEYLKIKTLKGSVFGILSDGEKRKVLLARAIINDPGLLILDEPAQGLDVPSRENLLELLQKIAEKTSLVYITHHVEELPKNITNLLLLKKGEVIKFGKIKEVLNSNNLSELFDYKINVKQVGQKYFLEY
jgi:iron complex transport system ATP-binding protein